jgi:hypothetical protein
VLERLRKVLGARPVATGAVALGLLGTSVGAGVIISGTPPGDPGTANIWVAAGGVNCVDNASPVAYVEVDACPTLDAANDTCDNGDTIRVASGTTVGTVTTATTTVDGSNSRTAMCTVKAAIDGDPISVTGSLALSGAWLTIDEPVWTNQTSNAADDFAQPYISGDDITLNDLDSSSIQVQSGATNVTVDGFDIGPCFADVANPICTPRVTDNSANTIFRDGAFHDQKSDDTPGACGSDTCHTVGLALFNGDTVLLDRVRFYNNKTTNIRIQDRPGGDNNDVTIQNSWFGQVFTASSLPSGDDTTTSTLSGGSVGVLNVDNPIVGLVIQFNSFYRRVSCPVSTQCGGATGPVTNLGTSGSPAVVHGNILSATNFDCASSFASYTYNTIFKGSSVNGPDSATGICGATNDFKAYNVDPPYVTPTTFGTAGLMDFHNTGTWSGDSLVTTGCISEDYDLQARTATCDAGSDER